VNISIAGAGLLIPLASFFRVVSGEWRAQLNARVHKIRNITSHSTRAKFPHSLARSALWDRERAGPDEGRVRGIEEELGVRQLKVRSLGWTACGCTMSQ